MKSIRWEIKPFEKLTTIELYKLIALRTEVFVVEQNCPYQECDGKDLFANHVLGFDANEIVACARILPVGVSYSDGASIGRVVVDKAYRMHGVGIDLMNSSLQFCDAKYPKNNVIISAQQYLVAFYEKFGFIKKGTPYLEDGIPHIQMVKLPLTKTKSI